MLVIFDCDGVLVESEVPALEALSTLLGEYGHPMSFADCRDTFMGRHNDDILRDVEALIGHALPGGGNYLRQRILDGVTRDLRPVDGVAEALRDIEDPRCVASSSDLIRIRFLLGRTGLEGFFGDSLFSGMDVARGKPAPDIFLHAAEKMGFSPAACMVIEDSVMGVQAAVAAGMRVVGFVGGKHAGAEQGERLRAAGADPIVPHMRDLPPLLSTLKMLLSPAS